MLQNEKITDQNNELEKYSRNLENMVAARTDELMTAKIKAEESDKLKTAFLANMSHELRTPLNAIVSFANLIAKNQVDEHEKIELAEIISANSDMLIRLFDDILGLSKIEAGALELNNTKINLHIFLSSFYKTKKETNFEKNSKIEWLLDLNNKNCDLICDVKCLEIILNNIVNNAFKYTEQGLIVIGYLIKESFVEFYVKDTGIGIPKEKFNMVFRRFVKVEEDKSRIYRGVGLGLALAQRLINFMGGSIWFDTEIAKGTTFFFTIPLKPSVFKNFTIE